jgi:hypothetical protein
MPFTLQCVASYICHSTQRNQQHYEVLVRLSKSMVSRLGSADTLFLSCTTSKTKLWMTVSDLQTGMVSHPWLQASIAGFQANPYKLSTAPTVTERRYAGAKKSESYREDLALAVMYEYASQPPKHLVYYRSPRDRWDPTAHRRVAHIIAAPYMVYSRPYF